MQIVIGSQDPSHINAVYKVLSQYQINEDIEIIPVPTNHGLGAQLVNKEVLMGARDRTQQAQEVAPEADYYILCQNGIFSDGMCFYEKWLMVLTNAEGGQKVALSDGILLPEGPVLEALKRGFFKTTVADVLLERGIVSAHDDYYLHMAGLPLSEIIALTAERLLAEEICGQAPTHS